MKLTVHVNCNAHEYKIIEKDSILCLHMPIKPIEGKANEKVIKMLSDHFGTAKSKIHIVQGLRSKVKVIEIEE